MPRYFVPNPVQHMKRFTLHKNLFPELAAAMLIFIFLYTSISKIANWQLFLDSLKHFPLLRTIPFIVACGVVWAELSAVLLLLLPKFRWIGLYFSLLLLILFTLYIGFMMLFASELPCSCGGIIQQLTWKQHLLLNLSLIVIAAAGIAFETLRRNDYHPQIP